MSEMLVPDIVGMIFLKLSMVYGRRFAAGYDADMQAVRNHWAHELAGLSMESIQYALANLPADHPPNVLTFRLLASCRPATPPPALPAPKPSPEVLQRWQEAAKAIVGATNQGARDHLAWAVKIHNNPQGKSRYARELAAGVLRAHGRIQ